MRWLILPLVVAGALLTGCGAGEVAEKVSGFEIDHFEKAFAPKFACKAVEDEIGGKKFPHNVYRRLVCLPRFDFLLKMAGACQREDGDIGEEFWIELKQEVYVLNCKNLERVAGGEDTAEILQDLRHYQREHQKG